MPGIVSLHGWPLPHTNRLTPLSKIPCSLVCIKQPRTCTPQVLLALEPARELLLSCSAAVAEEARPDEGQPSVQAWQRALQQFRGLGRRQLRSQAAWEGAARQLLPQLRALAQQAAGRYASERQPSKGIELRVARALALHACANPGCANVAGASEGRLRGRRCGGGCGVRYCSEACRDAAWPAHARVCSALAAGAGVVREQRGV